MVSIPSTRRFDEIVTVTRAVSTSAQSDWAVLEAADEQGELLRLVGTNLKPFAEPHRRIRMVGRWREDPRWGWQVEVRRAEPVLRFATAESSVRKDLERVPYVGAKRAQLLIDAHGPDAVLRHVDDDPQVAFRRVGLSLRQANSAARWWREQRRA